MTFRAHRSGFSGRARPSLGTWGRLSLRVPLILPQLPDKLKEPHSRARARPALGWEAAGCLWLGQPPGAEPAFGMTQTAGLGPDPVLWLLLVGFRFFKCSHVTWQSIP